MTKEELKEILELHQKWLNNEEDGKKADLRYADLRYVNLYNADLINADLRYANLYNANLDEKEKCRKGEILNKKIIGYKKCKDNVIVKLEIPKGAIVFGINGNKFRSNKVKCIDIENGDIAISSYDKKFTYEKGKTYIIDDFDLMYNAECGKGIHFFKTRKEAEEYDY